jgi:DNA uptake protein ComE-like DNA-binding protein
MWNLLTAYFSFTKKERRGIIFVMVALILAALAPRFFYLFVKNEVVNANQFSTEIAALEARAAERKSFQVKSYESQNTFRRHYQNETAITKERFYFDPNTASENDWLRLGIKKKTAQTIQKYIAKGGKFYKPRDIQKIYGLSQKDAEELMPYVSIAAIKKDFPASQGQPVNLPAYPKKKSFLPVDVNVADTAAFIDLPGIGSKLSNRIVSFREKLGGFYSIDQISEIYNLPDSTFQKIRPYLVLNSKAIKKININLATLDQLKAHPYIKYAVANSIVTYRQQHGNYTDINDLKKLMLVSDDLYNKLLPYLSVE